MLCSTSVVCIIDYICLLSVARPPCIMDAWTNNTLHVAGLVLCMVCPAWCSSPVGLLYAAWMPVQSSITAAGSMNASMLHAGLPALPSCSMLPLWNHHLYCLALCTVRHRFALASMEACTVPHFLRNHCLHCSACWLYLQHRNPLLVACMLCMADWCMYCQSHSSLQNYCLLTAAFPLYPHWWLH